MALRDRALPASASTGQAQLADATRLFTPHFLLICIGNLAFFTSFHMMTPTLPLYVLKLGGEAADAGLVVGAFAITALIGRPPSGWLSDVWQRKALMLVGAGLSALSTLLCILAGGVPLLLVVRLLSGFGLAAFSTASAVYVTDITPVHRRGEALGYFGVSGNLGLALGPALGIGVVQWLDFTWLFAIAGGLSLLSLVLAVPLVERSRPRRAAGSRRSVLQSLVLREALLPAWVAVCMGVSWGALAAFVPLFAQRQQIEHAGVFFTVVAVTLVLARSIAGRVSDLYGRSAVIVPGAVVAAFGVSLLAFANTELLFFAAALLYGMGWGAVHPAMLALAADRAKPEQRGIGLGTCWAGVETGIAIGASALGVVAQYAGFGPLFLLTGAIILLGPVGLLTPGWLRGRTGGVSIP